MTAHSTANPLQQMDALAQTASALGYEIVDIASFLNLLEGQAHQQRTALTALSASATEMNRANSGADAILTSLNETSHQSKKDVETSVFLVRNVGEKTRTMAGWVKSVQDRTDAVSDTLRAVAKNNTEIAAIATQVNTLAINAKIEAARAGDAGRGFAVVADAINDLSQKTSSAAKQISQNIDDLTGWVSKLSHESVDVANEAAEVLDQSAQTDQALTRMEATIRTEHEHSKEITQQVSRVRDAMERLRPAVNEIDVTVQETSTGIEKAHHRIENLIETSEQLVQLSAGLGGTSVDAPFIAAVQKTAQDISAALQGAISDGAISSQALFDQNYTAVPGTDPPQLMTQATAFLDTLLPQFQEPVLTLDPKIVFCTAADVNGYLPTHNAKFSHPQSDDVVWNIANCRNRRIFDDRVGLKAGQSTAPFLLQVYRRDMGGGQFRVMKDLSAPINVNGRHWGGLRLAYSY